MRVEVKLPTNHQQNELELLIRSVIANRNTENMKRALMKIVDSFEGEHVIIGCTELSVLVADNKHDRLIDPMKLIVNEIVGDER